MKKHLIILLLLICSTMAFGQSVTIQPTGGNARTEIKYSSNINDPQLLLNETAFGVPSYSRLTFKNSGFPTINNNFWTLAGSTDFSGGSHSNSNFNIYYGNSTFSGNSANLFSIKGDGKVGIGTTTPNYNLHVNDVANAFSNIQLTNTGTGTLNTNGLVLGIGSADAYLKNFQNGKLTLGTNNGDKMTILANGNVGIGTTTPASTLDVAGGANLSGTLTAVGGAFSVGTNFATAGSFITTGTGSFAGYFSSNGTSSYSIYSVGKLYFATGNQAAGKVLISDATGNADWGGNSNNISVNNISAANVNGVLANFYSPTNSATVGTFTTEASATNQIALKASDAGGATNIAIQADGFTKLGSAAAPAVKMKKITGTTNGSDGGLQVFAHGLTQSKILSVTILVNNQSTLDVPPNSIYLNSRYDFYVDNANIGIQNYSGNDSAITGRPVRILITYEQ